MSDLVVLVADLDTEIGLETLLERTGHLGVRPIQFRIFRHPDRDPGCRLRAESFLRSFRRQFSHALIVFDREGCGRDEASRQQIESDVERRVAASGWEGRCAAIVIEPELEAWVWSDSPVVDVVLGWHGRTPELRRWLRETGRLDAAPASPPGRRKRSWTPRVQGEAPFPIALR